MSSQKFVGQVGIVQYSTDSGNSWKYLMSTTKKTWKNDTEDIDITNDSSGTFKEFINSFMSPSLSCEGFSTLAAESSGNGSYKELQNLQLSGTQFNIRVVDNAVTPLNRKEQGLVFIKTLSEAMDTGKAVTFTVDFQFVNGFTNS